MAVYTLTVPDLGEGLLEATVVDWLVPVGDRVDRNDPLVEVETPKAAMELPSPVAGVVTALHAQPGDTLAVGSPLITLETAEQAGVVGTVPTDEQPTRRVRLTPPSS